MLVSSAHTLPTRIVKIIFGDVDELIPLSA